MLNYYTLKNAIFCIFYWVNFWLGVDFNRRNWPRLNFFAERREGFPESKLKNFKPQIPISTLTITMSLYSAINHIPKGIWMECQTKFGAMSLRFWGFLEANFLKRLNCVDLGNFSVLTILQSFDPFSFVMLTSVLLFNLASYINIIFNI